MALPALATVADVEAILGGPVALADVPVLTRLLLDASEAFRAQAGQEVSLVTGSVEELDCETGGVVVLPRFPVAAVTQVEVTGRDGPLGQDEYTWSRIGLVRGPWPVGYRTVKVTYDYGHAVIPASVVQAVARAVANRFRDQVSSATVLATGVTADSVLALVPEAKLNVAGANITTRPIVAADVLRWIDEAAADVSLRCAGWGCLPGSAGTDFVLAARRLVTHGAAATLERARFPERSSGPVDGSHASALQAIYDDGLARLSEFVSARVPGTGTWLFSRTEIRDGLYEGPLPW